ncbi:MAG: DJ-1/PfpI family protein [Proteobacteria bacterium]|nr:DJ-1/PfpI family protein [Pseudomonadota bacterium]
MNKKTNKRVLIPIPALGSDPSEVAIPWKLFTQRGFEVVFITPDGEQAIADQIMLKGSNLGLLKSVLGARQDAVDAYVEMEKCDAFCQPLKYSEANAADFDALHLPGGHDKTVRPYLESIILQKLVAGFFAAGKPVAAICHGVVLAARSKDPETGKSVLEGYQTTALLKSQELTGYNLTRLWMKDYYLTYPEITVEDEVRSVLADQQQFHKGPTPLLRDDEKHLNRGFALRDRNYLSARWPGDLYTYSLEFIKMIEA